MLCSCDKTGAPWVVKDAMAGMMVQTIIHTVCLEVGHGATTTPQNTLN